MGMRAPVKSPWEATATRDRINWDDIKDRIDMAAIATALFGPAPKRSGRRLLWPCPFHADHDPSLQVDPAERRWKCWPCNLGGDAPALVMRLKGVGFPEAVRVVAELAGIVAPSGKPARLPPPSRGPRPPAAGPAKAAGVAPEPSSGLPLADALTAVADAEQRLWSPEGADALEYLRRDRGLRDETVRAARLGWTPGVMLPTSNGARFWRASGITIPWWDRDRLALVKIRQPEGRAPKYAEAFRDRPRIYPGPGGIRTAKPLIVTEGEFDALLLGQELGELAAVVTLGSASARPGSDILGVMLAAPIWYLAHDADEAGDRSAEGWPARARRVRPPAPFKDWTEARFRPWLDTGVDLRRWWVEEVFPIDGPFAIEEREAIVSCS